MSNITTKPAITYTKFDSDRTRKNTLVRGLKNIGMASEKLYRNTLSQDILATAVMNFYAANFVKIQFLI